MWFRATLALAMTAVAAAPALAAKITVSQYGRLVATLPWAVAMVLLGLGTAMVYPTLLAAISDVAHPSWRASAVGVYRLWRDLGYAVGALLAGGLADLLGAPWAIVGIGLLTFTSGLVALARMQETLRVRRPAGVVTPAPTT